MIDSKIFRMVDGSREVEENALVMKKSFRKKKKSKN